MVWKKVCFEEARVDVSDHLDTMLVLALVLTHFDETKASGITARVQRPALPAERGGFGLVEVMDGSMERMVSRLTRLSRLHGEGELLRYQSGRRV